jgi:hypothetical protein
MIQIEKNTYLLLLYKNILPQVLEKYNAQKHSTTNMPPIFIEIKDFKVMKLCNALSVLSSESFDWKERINIVVINQLTRAANKASKSILFISIC